MPAKNSTKEYLENSYYHIYNRGVEKRLIFLDEQDYSVFLSYLKEYLLPKNTNELYNIISNPNSSWREKDKANKLLRMNNFFGKITLLAYCLMPNHFHLLVKQTSANSIDVFMNSLATRYTMYFNKKYKRVGTLYQAQYKAVIVSTDEQLLCLSRYIHHQDLASQGNALRSWQAQPSSYPDYLGKRKTEWVKPEEILSFFSKTNPLLSYKTFVESTDQDLFPITKLVIED